MPFRQTSARANTRRLRGSRLVTCIRTRARATNAEGSNGAWRFVKASGTRRVTRAAGPVTLWTTTSRSPAEAPTIPPTYSSFEWSRRESRTAPPSAHAAINDASFRFVDAQEVTSRTRSPSSDFSRLVCGKACPRCWRNPSAALKPESSPICRAMDSTGLSSRSIPC